MCLFFFFWITFNICIFMAYKIFIVFKHNSAKLCRAAQMSTSFWSVSLYVTENYNKSVRMRNMELQFCIIKLGCYV